MTNKEIGELFGELGSLMEIHGENEFRAKSYSNAYITIKKMDISLLDKTKEELNTVYSLNKGVAEKIYELSSTGKIQALEELRDKTPIGVRQMLKIKGVGPKKVVIFWKEMNLESVGELLYACKENRLIRHKGFGPKIQEEIIKNIEYIQSNQNSFLFPKIKLLADELIDSLFKLNPRCKIQSTGELRRCMPVLSSIELITDQIQLVLPEEFELSEKSNEQIAGKWREHFPVKIFISPENSFFKSLISTTGGSEEFIQLIMGNKFDHVSSEEDYFIQSNLEYIPPESRDLSDFSKFSLNELIEDKDILGVIHCHSTYSDGIYDLKTMAIECIRLGYQYLVISDHSKTAAYANGLAIERVEMQWREIDQLNIELSPFKIFKSIESDILTDGALDYPEDILKGFDLVIASIHSNLNMDEEKAMHRLIKAIENPFTSILGHLTGRLLLSRRGYPVDHKKIIDACASNQVALELNANPVRLDIDWSWITYAMNKEVLISINPDAHNLKGIQDIHFGTLASRKGGLTKQYCLNTKNAVEFSKWTKIKKY
ncbi:MAG: DNA polymerase/3'-5' exonuclease PolX [Saprospiraceae bacterium]|nr:DNA polymerase/3'-5' exonuclease PolX [Saprospiraceae bacterium]